MQGFEYPTEPHVRRHGPGGYQDYESYRDWVRDEFMFRCAYCLHRERWYGRGATFHIDHFIPVASEVQRELEYSSREEYPSRGFSGRRQARVATGRARTVAGLAQGERRSNTFY